jgi:hypothetical protein
MKQHTSVRCIGELQYNNSVVPTERTHGSRVSFFAMLKGRSCSLLSREQSGGSTGYELGLACGSGWCLTYGSRRNAKMGNPINKSPRPAIHRLVELGESVQKSRAMWELKQRCISVLATAGSGRQAHTVVRSQAAATLIELRQERSRSRGFRWPELRLVPQRLVIG